MNTWHLDVTPRQWQARALDIWKRDFSGVVSVVTGGGKTVFAFLCMLEFMQLHADGRVVIVVPTTALLDQWYVALRQELNVGSQEIAVFSGQEKADSPSLVNILVINTAREMSKIVAKGASSFLIVDECHRAGSPVNARSLSGTYRATLGLSATPIREYDEGFRQYVEPALGSIIFSYDYNDAYRDGVITPFRLINVRVPLLTHEQIEYDRLSRGAAIEFQRMKQGTGSEDNLKRLLQRRSAVSASASMRIPVAARLVELNSRLRTVVFHERVNAADLILHILKTRKHRTTVYHSKLRPDIRRDNLLLYRAGVFDVLISCRALDEGMNVPETQVAVIASATASTRQRIQRLGRVLRPAEGKNEAVIYTIYASSQEERRLRREARSLEGVSRVRWFEAGNSCDG